MGDQRSTIVGSGPTGLDTIHSYQLVLNGKTVLISSDKLVTVSILENLISSANVGDRIEYHRVSTVVVT